MKHLSSTTSNALEKSVLRGNTQNSRQNIRIGIIKILILAVILVVFSVIYVTIEINMSNEKLLRFALNLRIPRLIAMIITGTAIGTASIIFQTIVNNRIVTPSLLGMNSLYTLIHTAVVFFLGGGSIFVLNEYFSFGLDIVLMSVIGTVIYSYFFKKTGNNILYVLLIGTVMGSMFSSIQSTMVRVMDPNDYDSLLTKLVANFNKMHTDLVVFSAILMIVVCFVLRKDIELLDVIALGRNQAINLGVNYDVVVKKLLLGVTVFVTVSTALVGPITFLGLIIANLSRQLLSTYRHNLLITGSVLFGGIVLIGGQILIEHVFNYSAPISSFINVAGGVYFLYLILVRKGFG